MKNFYLMLFIALMFVGVSNAQVSHATCWNCSGSGRIVCGMCGGSGCTYTMFGPTACFACGGYRFLSCFSCGGDGVITYHNNNYNNYNTGGGYNVSSGYDSYSTGNATFTETIQNSESKQNARMEEYKNRYGW